MAYIYNMADTWADAGTTFTAIKMNVTDTASNAASLLMDLQTGGTSRFRVDKSGLITAGVFSTSTFGIAVSTTSIFGDALRIGSATGEVSVGTNAVFARDGANDTIAQRRGTNAQAFRVYNTFTDASNYERGVFDWTTQSNALTIGTQQAGSGIARSLRLITQGDGNLLFITNSVTRFDVSSLGLRATANLIWTTDNTFDIGASGATRPRRFFLGGGSLTGTEADSSLTISPTWNTTGTPTAILLNVTDTASNANSLLMDLQVGGVSKFSVTKSTVNSTVIQLNSNGGIADIGALGNSLTLAGSGGHNVVLPAANFQRAAVGYGFMLGTGLSTASAMLYGSVQEANHTIAQRNGTNAQAFRVYNTFTDASNFERLSISGGGASSFRIAAEASGTGTSRSIALDTAVGSGGIVFATGGTSRWAVSSSAGGGHFIASTDNTYDIGASGANRPRTIYAGADIFCGGQMGPPAARLTSSGVGTTGYFGFAASNPLTPDTTLARIAAGIVGVRDGTTGGAALSLVEQTAPAAPATNGVYIYAEDNGSGKTRLMARFATGAAVQIAIEP
jgi:hypothetical protein